MTQGVDWWTEVRNLYAQVMEAGDWKSGGSHEIEISPFVLKSLQSDLQNWTMNVDSRLGLGLYLFLGMFKPKVVVEEFELTDYDVQQAREIVRDQPELLHLAIRYEKQNGRFVYLDWDGNRDTMK